MHILKEMLILCKKKKLYCSQVSPRKFTEQNVILKQEHQHVRVQDWALAAVPLSTPGERTGCKEEDGKGDRKSNAVCRETSLLSPCPNAMCHSVPYKGQVQQAVTSLADRHTKAQKTCLLLTPLFITLLKNNPTKLVFSQESPTRKENSWSPQRIQQRTLPPGQSFLTCQETLPESLGAETLWRAASSCMCLLGCPCKAHTLVSTLH